jgi:hypothetical protein
VPRLGEPGCRLLPLPPEPTRRSGTSPFATRTMTVPTDVAGSRSERVPGEPRRWRPRPTQTRHIRYPRVPGALDPFQGWMRITFRAIAELARQFTRRWPVGVTRHAAARRFRSCTPGGPHRGRRRRPRRTRRHPPAGGTRATHPRTVERCRHHRGSRVPRGLEHLGVPRALHGSQAGATGRAGVPTCHGAATSSYWPTTMAASGGRFATLQRRFGARFALFPSRTSAPGRKTLTDAAYRGMFESIKQERSRRPRGAGFVVVCDRERAADGAPETEGNSML